MAIVQFTLHQWHMKSNELDSMFDESPVWWNENHQEKSNINIPFILIFPNPGSASCDHSHGVTFNYYGRGITKPWGSQNLTPTFCCRCLQVLGVCYWWDHKTSLDKGWEIWNKTTYGQKRPWLCCLPLTTQWSIVMTPTSKLAQTLSGQWKCMLKVDSIPFWRVRVMEGSQNFRYPWWGWSYNF